MSGADEGFLKRWSRLKQGEGDAPPTPAAGPQSAPPQGGEDEQGREPEAGAEPSAKDLDLPDIDTLDKDSDYTGFLREGVPQSLRRLALRKLWLSDPVFANLDGLNDYDENFALAFEAVKDVAQKVFETSKDGRAEGAGAEEVEDAADDAEAPGEDEAADSGDADSVAEAEPEAASPTTKDG